MYVRYENRSTRTPSGVSVNNFCHATDWIMCPDSTGSLSWAYSDKYVDFVYESVKASGYDGYMYVRGGSGNTTSFKKTRMNTSKSNERFRIEKTEQSVPESLSLREGNHVIWHYLR